MKLQNFHLQIADWSQPADRAALLQLRTAVFVEELGLPGLLESDELDADAWHLLARDDDGRAIGTARLDARRQISRLAVLPEWRGQSAGLALLRQLIDRARRLAWTEVRLDSPLHDTGFFARAGFRNDGELYGDGGLLVQPMRLTPKTISVSAREPPRRDPQPLSTDSREAIADARLQLLGRARRRVCVHLPLLELDAYASDAELAALRRIATSGRGAQIRILLHDTTSVARDGHRLLALIQRLTSAIEVRRPVDEIDLSYRAAYLLNDTAGYLLLADAQRQHGRAALNDAATQAPLQRHFDDVWQRAVPASELQRLGL